MGAKPGDFFLGVIDFFGILVPGSVLLFLIFFQHQWIGSSLDLHVPDTTQGFSWVIFVIASYVLGQFLTSMSVPLNNLLERFSPAAEDKYYKEVEASIVVPAELYSGVGRLRHLSSHAMNYLVNKEKRTVVFYRAFAFIRLKEKVSALTEIERQMAEYKLFRSLAVVFFLDVVLWLGGLGMVPSKIALHRIVLSFVLSGLTTFRFLLLLNWTYRITFEHYALLHSEQAATAYAATAGQNNAA
jgi:hypothetical protein